MTSNEGHFAGFGVRTVLIMVLAVSTALGGVVSVSDAASIRVDLTNQTMHVQARAGEYDWPISSARTGFNTPQGTYGVQRLEAMHYSHKYHNSPMPHSIFFRGGYAIHGTYSTASLGAPASHGCIRIAPGNAALLYRIARTEGLRISIAGAPPSAARYARSEKRRPREPEEASAYGGRVSPRLAYAPQYVYQRAVPALGDWLRTPTNAGSAWRDPDDSFDENRF